MTNSHNFHSFYPCPKQYHISRLIIGIRSNRTLHGYFCPPQDKESIHEYFNNWIRLCNFFIQNPVFIWLIVISKLLKIFWNSYMLWTSFFLTVLFDSDLPLPVPCPCQNIFHLRSFALGVFPAGICLFHMTPWLTPLPLSNICIAFTFSMSTKPIYYCTLCLPEDSNLI